MSLRGRRSLGARVSPGPLVALCASSAVISYSDDASAQTRKKKPKKPVNTQQEIELDAPVARSKHRRDGSCFVGRRRKRCRSSEQLASAAGRADDRAGRAGQAPLRQREVVGRRAGALPRLERRDRRRRGQQADRAVQPGEGPLQAQVLPGARTRSSARSPTSPTTSSTTRPSSGSRSSRPTCRSRPTSSSASASTTTSRSPSSTTTSSRISSGSSTTCSAGTSTATASTPRRSALFEKVDRAVASTTSRRSSSAASRTCSSARASPAVQSFQRILGAIDEGDVEVEDEARMRDLAYLSMARTFYSASVKLDEQQRADRRPDALSRGGQVLEQGRRWRASTGSTPSSRSRGRTSWPATTATPSATSTRSRRRTSRTRTTRRPTSSRRSSTSRTASTTTRSRSSRKFRGEVRADPRRR